MKIRVLKYAIKYKDLFCTFIMGLLFLFLSYGAAAQAAVFEVEVDSREVSIEDIFELRFTLRNAGGSGFTAPPLRDFQVFSGPAIYTSTTVTNGKVSQTNSYIYTIQARRLGSITIGPAFIKVNNKILETAPIVIRVVPASAQVQPGASAGNEADCFVRAEPVLTKAYVGQQVALDYKVYRTVNIESATIIKEPAYQGFFKEDTEDRERFSKEVRIGGQRWLAQTMKRVALFPQQTGTLTADPITLQLNVVAGSNDPFGFFGQTRPVKRSSNAVKIEVLPLPEGAPSTFSGAVGQYTAAAALTNATVSTGDIISLHLTVEGNGDPKRIQAPVLSLPEGLEIYDTRITSAPPQESGDQIIYTRIFEYLLKSRKPGNFSIRPVFSWFDPADKRYHTWNEKVFSLVVKAGAAADHPAPDLPAGSAPESFWRWDNVAIPAVLAFVLTGVFFLYRVRKKSSRENSQPEQDMTVPRRAIQPDTLLTLAYSQLKAGNRRAFYDALSKDMYDLAASKFGLLRSDYSIEKVKECLILAGKSPALIQDFTSVLEQCEMAIFAAIEAGDMENAYERAKKIVSELLN